jgi:hypothetical protein
MAVGVASTSTIGTRFPGGVPRSDKYHKPKRADRRAAFSRPRWNMLAIAVFLFLASARLQRCRKMIDFLTHASQHCDIYHNGGSGFYGNADIAETADLTLCLI